MKQFADPTAREIPAPAISDEAVAVVVDLASVCWIRHRVMDTPGLQGPIQTVGGTLVFLTGILTGSA